MRHFLIFIFSVAVSIASLSSCNDVLSIDDQLDIMGESLGEWDIASSAYPSWIEDMEAITFHNSREDKDEDVRAFIMFQCYSSYWCPYARDVYSFSYGGKSFIAVHDKLLSVNLKIRDCCDELTLFYTSDGRRVRNKAPLQKQFEKSSTLLWSNRIEYGNNAEQIVRNVYTLGGFDVTNIIKQNILDVVKEVKMKGETIREIEFCQLKDCTGLVMSAVCFTDDCARCVSRRLDPDGKAIELSEEEYQQLSKYRPFIWVAPESIKGYEIVNIL